MKEESSLIARPSPKEVVVEPLVNGCFNAVLYLNIPLEESVKRADGRRFDPSTKEVYHLVYNPPPEDNK